MPEKGSKSDEKKKSDSWGTKDSELREKRELSLGEEKKRKENKG
jgi:hypothetical protein